MLFSFYSALCVFFFQQKTAYDLRISDWSSDVCSSDLFYSIGMLPPVWQKITLFNPVVYLISGFRWSFYGVSDVNVAISVAAILGFLVLCLLAVWWIFRTGWKLKS